METEILFSEKQKFRQWWVWFILLSINGLLLYGVFEQIIKEQQFGDNPMSNTGLLVTSSFALLFTILFLNLRLDTNIKDDGIYVRFFPFHLKFRHYSWDMLTKSYIRKYSPLAEYGGWGIRIGLFGKGKAFNVSGNKGLQLKFTNRKKLLIGTNKPEELSKVLKRIGQLKQ